ncbi:hypothetical protein, partial [Salmonella enterica]|uniref:hypothetical protein n=1 Tax=Salmonella enterica TaxID=28901 RepID=UPI0020A35371
MIYPVLSTLFPYTPLFRSTLPMNAVYPRWRGEHTDKQPHSLETSGKSLKSRHPPEYLLMSEHMLRFVG